MGIYFELEGWARWIIATILSLAILFLWWIKTFSFLVVIILVTSVIILTAISFTIGAQEDPLDAVRQLAPPSNGELPASKE